MPHLDIIISFVVGVCAILLLALIFSIKTKGFVKILINIIAGVTILLLLTLFKVPYFKLNPLSAFLVGTLGAIGIIVIYVIMAFF